MTEKDWKQEIVNRVLMTTHIDEGIVKEALNLAEEHFNNDVSLFESRCKALASIIILKDKEISRLKDEKKSMLEMIEEMERKSRPYIVDDGSDYIDLNANRLVALNKKLKELKKPTLMGTKEREST